MSRVTGTAKYALVCLVTTLLVLLPCAKPAADQTSMIDFDIFEQGGQVVVWVDLAPLITAKGVRQMKDGIDVAIEYKVSLLRPRRLWGAQTIREISGILQIGHRLVTEDFFLSHPDNDESTDRYFLSLGELHRYLTDSITVNLLDIDSLEHSRHYFTRLKLTFISLSELNRRDIVDPDRSSQSAVQWLFEGFLDLTEFGRQDYQVESRLFSPSEISSGQ